MVTMAVSTVSVIESIIVISLCSRVSSVKPLSPLARLVAFRLLGRLLCVSGPSTSVAAGRVRPSLIRDGRSSPEVKDATSVAAAVAPDPAEKRRSALDDVLAELRKVVCACNLIGLLL